MASFRGVCKLTCVRMNLRSSCTTRTLSAPVCAQDAYITIERADPAQPMALLSLQLHDVITCALNIIPHDRQPPRPCTCRSCPPNCPPTLHPSLPSSPPHPHPQTGKSGGSMLQQALLLLSAGAITGPILPTLFGCFFLMLRGWLGAVRELSSRRRYTLNSPMHTGEEEEPWPQPSAGSAVVVAPPQPLQPAEVAARVRDLEREER